MQRTQQFHQDLVRILVVGIGSGGSDAVNRLARRQHIGVDLATIHGSESCYTQSGVAQRLLLPTPGEVQPHVLARGRAAARMAAPALRRLLQRADIVVLAAGLGGETAGGAAPEVARLARDAGAVTLGVVWPPLASEPARRHETAERSLERLRRTVDALLPFSQNTLRASCGGSARSVAHVAAEQVGQTVDAISGVVNRPGLINVDFADLRAVLGRRGETMVATGCGEGPDAALLAAKAAAKSRLLNIDAAGAMGMIVQISGGPDLSLQAVNQIMDQMRLRAGEDALLVMGTALDFSLGERIRVTVIATGIGGEPTTVGQRPQRWVTDPGRADDRPVAAPQRATLPDNTHRPRWRQRRQLLPAV